jgi:hypothetical protein
VEKSFPRIRCRQLLLSLLSVCLTALFEQGISRNMKLRRIAAFLLIFYAAICVVFVVHDHLTDRPGGHCGICQILHAPAYTQPIATQAPAFIVQDACMPVLQIATCSLPISPESERAPPGL